MTPEQHELYRRYLPLARASAWRVARRHPTLRRQVDDIDAACRVALWRAVTTHDPARGAALASWVCRLTRGAAEDYARLHGDTARTATRGVYRRRPAALPLEAWAERPAGRRHDAAEYLDQVLAGLDPRRARIAALLREGLEQHEVARRLGITPSRVSHALAEIRRHALARRENLFAKGA